MDARTRRGVGNSIPFDAQRMATAVLALEIEQLRYPRADNGIRAALRFLTAAREQMTTKKTTYLNALTAIVRATELGIDVRKPLTTSQVHEISAWRHRTEELSHHRAPRSSGWPCTSWHSNRTRTTTRRNSPT